MSLLRSMSGYILIKEEKRVKKMQNVMGCPVSWLRETLYWRMQHVFTHVMCISRSRNKLWIQLMWSLWSIRRISTLRKLFLRYLQQSIRLRLDLSTSRGPHNKLRVRVISGMWRGLFAITYLGYCIYWIFVKFLIA